MKRHISSRNLAAYIADTMDPSARDRFTGHLTVCERCRVRHDELLHAFSPRYADMQPHALVRARVMRTRGGLEKDSREPAGAGLPLRLNPRILGASALGLAAAVAVALVFFLVPPSPQPNIRPALVAIEAGDGVTIGDEVLLNGARVRESSVIVVFDNKTARFAYGAGFSLILSGPSVMRIDRLDRSGQSGGVVLECTLEQGLLVSRAEGGSVAYAYATPGASVRPSGTEFLLQASGGDTLVLMKSGAARVRSSRTGETAVVRAGRRCEVMERVRVSPAAADDMRIIDRPETLRGEMRGLRLLPVLPLPEKIFSERRGKDERVMKRPRVRRVATGGREERRGERLQGRGGSEGRGERIHDARPAGRSGAGGIDKKRNSAKEMRKVRREKKRVKRASTR